MLNLIDEFSRECLAIRIDRKLRSTDVIDVLSDLFILRGVPDTSGPTTARSSWRRRCGTGSPPWAPDCLHRTRQSLGERLLRELQREAPRRAAQRRDLLQSGRGPDPDRELAPPLQYQAPAFIAGVSATGTGGHLVAGFATRSRFAGHASRSAQTRHALRLKPDHPMGAGQGDPPCTGTGRGCSDRALLRLRRDYRWCRDGQKYGCESDPPRTPSQGRRRLHPGRPQWARGKRLREATSADANDHLSVPEGCRSGQALDDEGPAGR